MASRRHASTTSATNVAQLRPSRTAVRASRHSAARICRAGDEHGRPARDRDDAGRHDPLDPIVELRGQQVARFHHARQALLIVEHVEVGNPARCGCHPYGRVCLGDGLAGSQGDGYGSDEWEYGVVQVCRCELRDGHLETLIVPDR